MIKIFKLSTFLKAYPLHTCFISVGPAVREDFHSRHIPREPTLKLFPSLPSLNCMTHHFNHCVLSGVYILNSGSLSYTSQSKSQPWWMFLHIFTQDTESTRRKNIQQCFWCQYKYRMSNHDNKHSNCVTILSLSSLCSGYFKQSFPFSDHWFSYYPLNFNKWPHLPFQSQKTLSLSVTYYDHLFVFKHICHTCWIFPCLPWRCVCPCQERSFYLHSGHCPLLTSSGTLLS